MPPPLILFKGETMPRKKKKKLDIILSENSVTISPKNEEDEIVKTAEVMRTQSYEQYLDEHQEEIQARLIERQIIDAQDALTREFALFFDVKEPIFVENYSRGDFPKEDGVPIKVSRLYVYGQTIVDIVESEDQAKSRKKRLEDIGFAYTWITKQELIEGIPVEEVFKNRLEPSKLEAEENENEGWKVDVYAPKGAERVVVI